MVNKIRKALAGFILMPGRSSEPAPQTPHLPERMVMRACPLRGFANKEKDMQVMVLPGHDEPAVVRELRAVVVEGERAPRKGHSAKGLNLVVFRGVFGSGGYDIDVQSVSLEQGVLRVLCDFENPGSGIRTTAGFTQPTAIIPLKRLPTGRYKVKLSVRHLRRSSQGLEVETPSHEVAQVEFKVCG